MRAGFYHALVGVETSGAAPGRGRARLTAPPRHRSIVVVRFHRSRRGGRAAVAVLVPFVIAALLSPALARSPRSRPAEKVPPVSPGPSPQSARSNDVAKGATSTAGRGARGVRVTIDSDDETVVLEGQAADTAAAPAGGETVEPGPAIPAEDAAEVPLPLDDGRWDVMCSPPCQRRLPRAALFRITGAGVTTSSTFSLPARRSEVTLQVDTGISRWYWTGVVAAIAGGTFILGSVGPRLALGGSFTTVEKVMTGAGLVLVGGGGTLWWFNRTRVAIF